MPKPVILIQPTNNQKPVTAKTLQKKWNFSFKFWKQIDYFGLDQSRPSWFVSLLERLQAISNESIDEFVSDPSKRSTYRFHAIDWNKRNIPVQREDLYWIHADYLKNEEEFPLVQFQISKALGRIVGFFDEERTFNIVLLDPLHNIQPTKAYEYKVDPCHPLSCEISLLRYNLEKLSKGNDCQTPSCSLASGIKNINKTSYSTNILILNVNDIDITDCEAIFQYGQYSSYAEILQLGIAASSYP